MSDQAGRELLPCPCGKVPTELSIGDAGQGGKWAWVGGNCCGDWQIEFRTGYHGFDTDECKAYARQAWNEASRAATSQQPQGEALYTMDQMRQFADDFHQSRAPQPEGAHRVVPVEPTEAMYRAYKWRADLVNETCSRDVIRAGYKAMLSAAPVSGDARRLDWLEDQYTLHKSAEFLYVVDGYYIALLEQDGETEVARYHGDSLRDAIDAAIAAQPGEEK